MSERDNSTPAPSPRLVVASDWTEVAQVASFKGEPQPVAFLRYGETVPVQNVPWGAMWISDKNDPRAFPVYRCQHSPIDVSEDMVTAYQRAEELAKANIQGFYEEELGHHYVRDLRKPSGSQIIWEVKYITHYDAGHGAMVKAIDRFVATEAIRAALATETEGGECTVREAADEIEELRDRAETAVVAANALQARLNAVESALQEQVDACDVDDCEMCHLHRSLLAKPEGSANG